MSFTPLPSQGSTNWYGWAGDVHSALNLVINVKNYGAKGDGVTNDTAAVQAALAAAQSAGLPLYFPTGSYKVTASLGNVDIRKTPLRGDGPQRSQIVSTGLAQGTWLLTLGWDATTSATWYQLGAAMSGLTLVGDQTSTACNGVQLQGWGTNPQANNLKFSDVCWDGFATQLQIGDHSYINSFQHCQFMNAQTRAVSIDQRTDAGENISFVSCTFANCNGTLVYIDMSGSDFHFLSCSFDYSARALQLRGGRVVATNCHFEANSQFSPAVTEYLLANRRGSQSVNLSLTDCTFAAFWDSYDTCIRLTGDTTGGNALRVTDPHIVTSATMAPYFVRDDGPTPSDVAITGASYSNAGFVAKVRDNAGETYWLTAGVTFANRPARSVRRIASTAIEPFPAVVARGLETPDNGTVFVTLFSPTEDITITGAAFWTGATAQTGATLIRVGLYDWDPVQGTLKASSANDTTLASTTFTRYAKSFTTPLLCQAGGVYGLALIVVGASTSPIIVSAGNNVDWVLKDGTYGHPVSLRVTGQTDLPGAFFGGISTQKTFYMVGIGS